MRSDVIINDNTHTAHKQLTSQQIAFHLAASRVGDFHYEILKSL